jgi:predicted RecB family nuclease
MLSDGRFIIAKMARLLYPEGIAIVVDESIEQGINQTQQELSKDQVVLFEPVIFANHKLVRPDILVKQGDRWS